MKKNWTMRVGVLMLALTLITSCFVGNTFAKYVTQGSAADSARVAKFGVVIAADGQLFGEEYATKDGNNIIAYTGETNTGTVQVEAQGKDVVAPGTKNTTGGLNLSVTGKPEVDVTTELTIKTQNVFLAEGTYAVFVSAEVTKDNFKANTYYQATEGGFELVDTYDETITDWYKIATEAVVEDDPYFPVVYTSAGVATDATEDSAKVIAQAIADELKGEAVTPTTADGITTYTVENVFQANTDLAEQLKKLNTTLNWEWTFENDDLNSADTILGDIVAGVPVYKFNTTTSTYEAVVVNTDYCVDTQFDITLTVTQID